MVKKIQAVTAQKTARKKSAEFLFEKNRPAGNKAKKNRREKARKKKNNLKKAKSEKTLATENNIERGRFFTSFGSHFFIGQMTGYTRQLLVALAGLGRSRVFVGAVFVLLLSGAYMHFNTGVALNQWADDVFPVKSVQIEGEFKFLDKARLKAQVLPAAAGGFFTADLLAIRQRLVGMAWVENVSVRRQWPDRLLVQVVEKQPVVYWGEKGVISSKGALFEPQNRLSIELPHLSGPQGQHQVMLAELARMQAWLLETGFYIRQIEQNARRSWTLRMTTGLELRLGRMQLHERLHRFVSIYKTHFKNEKREIKHIDMRYTNGFAVAWKEA